MFQIFWAKSYERMSQHKKKKTKKKTKKQVKKPEIKITKSEKID